MRAVKPGSGKKPLCSSWGDKVQLSTSTLLLLLNLIFHPVALVGVRAHSLPASLSLCLLNGGAKAEGQMFVMEIKLFFLFPQSMSSSMSTSCWINPFINSLLPSTTASTVCAHRTHSWWDSYAKTPIHSLPPDHGTFKIFLCHILNIQIKLEGDRTGQTVHSIQWRASQNTSSLFVSR